MILPIPIAAATAGSAAPLAVTAPIVHRLDTGLRSLAGEKPGQTPALGVAVVQSGRIVYDRGFGQAATDSQFRIGSITKMFTAVAVMQLVERGKIALDAPVATYLPDAPHAGEITVRQLLQNRSGLWNYADEAFSSGAVSKPTTPQAILTLAAAHPLTSTPGTHYAYSNTNYVVLGLIVERASGRPLQAYERERIFSVAGMRATAFGGTSGDRVVPGYMTAGGAQATKFDASWLWADGDIVSTAGDVARFDIALLGGKLVSPATFDLMQAQPVTVDEPAHVEQGLGLEIVSALGLHFVGHHGGVPGFEAETETLPSDGVAVVVLSDAFDFPTREADRVVIQALYPNTVAAAASEVGPEDRTVTSRFRAALAGLLNGSVDRSKYSDAAGAALTPEFVGQLKAQLAPLGSIADVLYLGKQDVSGQTVYRYRVTFSSGAMLNWIFALGTDGKITAIQSTG
jgi:CubicO group peptidase (beta-lactamase class C family)